MPKIIAYVLLADPEWLVPSVYSYLNICDTIIGIYDEDHIGHAGAKIDVRECLRRLECFNEYAKIKLIKGKFTKFSSPHANEHDQRSTGVSYASELGADWVLHIDNDEILPDSEWLYEQINSQLRSSRASIEIASRVYYSHEVSRLLQIAPLAAKSEYYENLAIAVKPFTKLQRARFAKNQLILSPKTSRGQKAKQLAKRILGRDYLEYKKIPHDKCIMHMSWVRSKKGIEQKVKSWGHATDFDVESYLQNYWEKAFNGEWAELTNIHPIWPEMWGKIIPKEINDLHLNGKIKGMIHDELAYIRSRDNL